MTYTPLIREQYRMSKEPTGFPNQTDTTISFNNGTRVFSIAPVGATFDFFVGGVRYIKSTTQSAPAITNTEGLWYFYFDASGVLQSTNVFVPEIITQYAYVSLVYWDATNLQAIYFAEERHGLTMDGVTHSYLHNSIGAVYLSGFALNNFAIDGTGDLATNAQLSCGDGSFYDEDIKNVVVNGSPQVLSPTSQIPVFYRNGSGTWRRKAADVYPVIYSGTAGYTGANGRLPYNQFTGGTWLLTEVNSLKYVLVHYFATNDKNHPIVGVQGMAEYANLNDARAGASTEIANASGLPFSEFIAIGSVIFQTSATYLNVPKARTRTTDTGANYVDFRATADLPLGSVTSHSNLSGLTNPDHPAAAIFTNTTNFNNVLSAANTTVQSALDTLDNIILMTDGDKGDITVSGSGASWTIDATVVTNAKLANVSTATFKGRTTAGTGSPEDLTGTQATALLDAFTTSLKGLAPASGGGTTNYLRADGTWAAPLTDGDKGDITVSGSGATWTIDATVVTNAKLANVATATFKGRTTAGTGSPEDLTATQATALLNVFSSTLKGLTPLSGGGTSNYLRADGTWAVPTGSFTSAAADLLYLKLDTTNGPLTNTLTINKTTPSASAPTLTTPTSVDLWLSAASNAGSRSLFISSNAATTTDNGVVIAGSDVVTSTHTSVLVNTAVGAGVDRYAFRVANATGDIIRLNGLSQTLHADGTAANPSVSFLSSVGSGLYYVAANTIGFAINGSELLRFLSTGIDLASGQIRAAGGSAAAPSFAGNSTNSDTGFYVTGTDNAGISTSGVARLTVTPTTATFAVPVTATNLSGTNTGDQTITLTSDVTGSGTGSFATTIASGVVSNAKLANVATATFKGRTTAGTGSPEDLTGTQATALLDAFTTSLKGLAPASGGGTANYLRADGTWATPPGSGLTDGDKGDITVSGGGTTWTIDATVVTNAKLANVATATFKGRTTAGSGSPEDLTGTQATALLDAFTTTLKGLTPASGGGTSNFLRADGTWAVPTGSGGVTDGDKGDITVSGSGATWTIDATVVTNAKLANVATATFKGRTTAGTGSPEDLTATQATALLDVFTTTLKGLAPASGGGTANFLRADGTWAAPTVSGTFANGSSSAPSINFTGDTDTGFYWNGSSGDIGIASNGVGVFVIGDAGLSASVSGGARVRPTAGDSATSPAYSFRGPTLTGDATFSNMGMYRSAADTLAFSTASTQRLSISASVIATTLDLAVGVATANEKATVEGRLSLRETTAPTATANYGKVYAKSGDAQLYFLDDTGQEYKLSGIRKVVGLVIDGAGSVITTGIKQYIRIPTGLNGVITKWTLLADQAGDIVIDVWKDTFANYPPTVADTITAAAKPALSSAISGESSVLTGWTTTVTEGDVIAFSVDSAATVTKVTLELEVLT